MNLLEELLLYLITKDRIGFLKFRHKVIKKYNYHKFAELLKIAEKELNYETT